ncbi:YhjD/YihY/BrkB family envelope integrity protein [Cupriavidus basilensis]
MWTQSWFAPVAEALFCGIFLCVVTLLFAVIFKMLPNARIAWRDVIMGAVITALLFAGGQAADWLSYLGNSAVRLRLTARPARWWAC